MVKYEKMVLGAMQTNCYLVWDDKSKEAMIIDPADEGVEIAQHIQHLELKPILVAATHGHFDHLLGALDLMLIFNIPLALSQKDMFLLERQEETAEYFLRYKIKTPNIKKIDIDLEKVLSIRLGEEKIKLIQTPGHTPGGVCFYTEKQGMLWSGDTLFAGGSTGDTRHKYSSIMEMRQSLRKLWHLPQDTLILPGHGDEDTIGNCRISLGGGET